MNTLPVPSNPSLPASTVEIRSHAGNLLGHRHFFGTKSASEIKVAGRALGLKGVALSKYVNNALRDEKSARAVEVAMAVTALSESGYVAEKVDKKSKTASISFIKVSEPAAPKESKKVSKLWEMLKDRGLTDAEIAAALTA